MPVVQPSAVARAPGALDSPSNAASVKVVPGRHTVGYCRAGVKDPWVRFETDAPGRRDRMAMPPCFHLCSSPTTPQSVLPWAAHRTPVTGVCILRRSCDGKRRTPLCGESERMRAQAGHSTKATPLSANRVRSMATTPANVHLGDVFGGPCASTVFVVFCSPFTRTVSCGCAVPCALPGAAPSGRETSTLGPAPSMICSVSRRSTSS